MINKEQLPTNMTCATSPEKAAESAHRTTTCQAIFLQIERFYLTPAQLPPNKTLTLE